MSLDFRAYEDQTAGNQKKEYAEGYMVAYLKDAPMITAKIYLGKSTKPYKYFRFKTVEERAAYVEKMATNVTANRAADVEYKAKRKIEKKEATKKFIESLKVGVVLQGSYGYEQTNQHYYEVIEKKGSKVVIRELCKETVESTGWASARVKPATGEHRFYGEPTTHNVRGYGIKIHSSLSVGIWDGQPDYASWYS